MTTPTDHDLNVSLAGLMGLDIPERLKWTIPDWRGSLDALFAPGGPVDYGLRQYGFKISLTSAGMNKYEAEVLDRAWVMILDEPVIKDSPAEALATALHEAFMKEQGQ